MTHDPRVALLRRLAGSGWSAGATTLRTATLDLVHSTAEYCATVWCRSAHIHLINPAINYAFRIVTGCLRPTPADNLPILADILLADLRGNGATLSLAGRALEPGHLLHSAITRPSSADARRLKSRHPFVTTAQHLISASDNNSIRAAQWADHRWNAEWTANPTRLRIFITDTTPEWPSQKEPVSVLTTSTLVSDVSAPACTDEVWPPLRSVSVAQKNKPSAMLSSNAQSIDLLMDCTAWRFWTMRQSNDCSRPAPRSGTAKQCLEELAQKKKSHFENQISQHFGCRFNSELICNGSLARFRSRWSCKPQPRLNVIEDYAQPIRINAITDSSSIQMGSKHVFIWKKGGTHNPRILKRRTVIAQAKTVCRFVFFAIYSVLI